MNIKLSYATFENDTVTVTMAAEEEGGEATVATYKYTTETTGEGEKDASNDIVLTIDSASSIPTSGVYGTDGKVEVGGVTYTFTYTDAADQEASLKGSFDGANSITAN